MVEVRTKISREYFKIGNYSTTPSRQDQRLWSDRYIKGLHANKRIKVNRSKIEKVDNVSENSTSCRIFANSPRQKALDGWWDDSRYGSRGGVTGE